MNIKTLLFAITVVFGFANTASAAVLYVNNSAACPGNGSSATPYCSIQDAFDAANAGDNIRIRTGSGAYAGASTPSGRSGTSASPIIVEPDTGANPNITAEIDIVD